MTFKSLAAGIFILGASVFSPSFAGCISQVTEDIDNNFTSAVMCTNTLPSPTYQISYYEDGNATFSMFSFDKLNAGYMCISHGEVEGDNLHCRKSGVRSVPQEFKNGKILITMMDLSFGPKQRKFKALFNRNFEFATAKTSHQAELNRCFVGVRDDDVFIAFHSNDIYPLSNCLFSFEEFLAENPQVWLRLN